MHSLMVQNLSFHSSKWRENVRDSRDLLRSNIERNDEDTSKPVARHFDLPNHSKQHMTVCDLSLYLGSLESCKTL